MQKRRWLRAGLALLLTLATLLPGTAAALAAENPPVTGPVTGNENPGSPAQPGGKLTIAFTNTGYTTNPANV